MRSRLSLAAFTAVFVLVGSYVTRTQPVYETVHSFSRSPGRSLGRLLQASNGRLYGMASVGGSHSGGAIFMAQQGSNGTWTTSILHEFSPAEGQLPLAGLIESPTGVLFGTTAAGGAFGGGTVFRASLAGDVQVIHSFQTATEGSAPLFGPLVRGTDGALYGATYYGGAYGRGTVFRITDAGVFSVLHAFTPSEGRGPSGGLTRGADSLLWGTTIAGGASNVGTVFRISNQGAFSQLHSFTGVPNTPLGGLVQAADGDFYGTLSSLNTSGCGLDCAFTVSGGIFRFTQSGNTGGVAYSFTAIGFPSNVRPLGALTLGSDGLIYGVGESADIFRFDPVLPLSVEVLYRPAHEFPLGAPAGNTPTGGLIQGSDANFYSVSYFRGDGDQGTLFSFDPDTPAINALHHFDSPPYYPTGGLTLLPGGKLYGTASRGGHGSCDDGCGGVYSLSGTVVTPLTTEPFERNLVHLFGDLTRGDGNLLYAAGENGVIGVTTDGTLSVITHGLTTTHAPLLAADGSLYFVSGSTIFNLQPGADVLTLVHVFTVPDGLDRLVGGLIQTADGAIYGTTMLGGAYGLGMVFHLAPDWTVTTLHDFDYSDGAYPLSTLLAVSDGFFYGTTFGGGLSDADSGNGTIFRIKPDGSDFATLRSLTLADGVHPVAGLSESAGPTFFGTASAGGAGNGSVFSITPAGAFSRLHAFNEGEGKTPIGGVTVMPDGTLYGTTLQGGATNQGVIFQITPRR